MLDVAVIGGGIGGQHINGYAQLSERFRVTAVCDLNQDLARNLAAQSGGRSTADIDDVLADPDIDIVDICLPPAMHVPVATRVLKAGKHAIVEKPVAGSLVEADQLVAAAARSRGNVFPVFQYRYGKAFDQLAALRAAGVTGRPLSATIETHWSRDKQYYANLWRGSWDHELGGAVLIHAIHAHDLLTQHFGAVAEVAAVLTTNANPVETEDCAAISLRMVNGALVTSSITLGAATNTTRMRLVYEHLTAESGTAPYAPGTEDWHFTARNCDRQAEINAILQDVPDGLTGFAGYFDAIADALEGHPGREVTLADGLASIELVSAIYHSDRSSKRVSLPVDRSLRIATSLRP